MMYFQLVNTLDWYGHKFKDPMMLDPPAWFKSFCICELFLQFPFFFVAVAAFMKGKFLINSHYNASNDRTVITLCVCL